jgi:hypothetical protein
VLVATIRSSGETYTPNWSRVYGHQENVGVACDPQIITIFTGPRPPAQAGSRTRTASAIVVMLALCLVVAAGAGLGGAASRGAAKNASVARVCKTVKVNGHRRHWVPKTRKVHGHRVVVRRHGKIVYVRVRAGTRRALRKRVCRATPAVPNVSGAGPSVAAPNPAPGGVVTPRPLAHVMVLVEENRNRSEVIRRLRHAVL